MSAAKLISIYSTSSRVIQLCSEGEFLTSASQTKDQITAQAPEKKIKLKDPHPLLLGYQYMS